MDVTVENPGGLERKLKVQIPADRLSQSIDEKIRRVGQNAQIPGFRPGKVPKRILLQRYGERVRYEAASELVQSSYPEAVEQAEIKPAGQPQIELGEVESGSPLEFTASVDVYPEIELTGLDTIQVERPVAEVTDDDIDTTIERIRSRNKTSEVVERAAREGDQVTVDYVGRINGEVFESGSAEDVTVPIGSDYFLKDLEQALPGHAAGETFTADVTFPDDYEDQDLAGRAATLAITVKRVAEERLPELNEDFIKQLDVEEGTLEALETRVRESLQQEVKQAVDTTVKTQVMDGVYAANPIDVPESMVAEECDRMRKEAAQQLPPEMQNDEAKLRQMLPDSMLRDRAVRRVALGLLISEIISERELEIDPDRIEAKLAEIAEGYGAQADQVKSYYQQNPQMMEGLQAMVMEEQVVDQLLDDATVTNKPMSLEDLLAQQHQEAAAGA